MKNKKIKGSGKSKNFFNYGLSCINTAKYLFENKPDRFYAFSILYIHGIELILKSFLLFKNGECATTHNYMNLYIKCKKFNEFPKSNEVENVLQNLSKEFYSDTIMARYEAPERSENTMRRRVGFKKNTIWILDEELIKPLQQLLK